MILLSVSQTSPLGVWPFISNTLEPASAKPNVIAPLHVNSRLISRAYCYGMPYVLEGKQEWGEESVHALASVMSAPISDVHSRMMGGNTSDRTITNCADMIHRVDDKSLSPKFNLVCVAFVGLVTYQEWTTPPKQSLLHSFYLHGVTAQSEIYIQGETKAPPPIVTISKASTSRGKFVKHVARE